MRGHLSKQALHLCSTTFDKKTCQRCKTSSSETWLQSQTQIIPKTLNSEEIESSLKILKKGAISAIMEKEDHLSSMTQVWTNHLQLYKTKLGECMQVQQELHRSHHELSLQLDQQRHHLRCKLEERETKLWQLLDTIEELKDYIEQIQKKMEQKEFELLEYKQQIDKMKKIIQEYQLKNVLECLSERQGEAQKEEYYETELLEEKYLKEIENLNLQHQKEIHAIVRLYQEKIAEKNQETHPQYEHILENTPQKQSPRSLSRSRSDADPHSPLHPPSLASQPSVHNLRQQIFPEEQLSQFTKEIFSIPSLFHKQHSCLSYTTQKPNITPTKDNKETETEGFYWEKDKDNQVFWEKTKTFVAGFFSGASLGSVISVAALRWKQ